MTEEIEDLQLEIQGLLSCLDRDEMYSVCEKLQIEKIEFKGDLSTVKILMNEIQKQLDKLQITEKAAFLKQIIEIINPKNEETKTTRARSDIDCEERRRVDRESEEALGKQYGDSEATGVRLDNKTGKMGDGK